MIRKIKDYILDNEFKMHFYDNKINIINYVDIGVIESNKITIKCSDKSIIIKGESLHLKKLLEQEILIEGNIKYIELE